MPQVTIDLSGDLARSMARIASGERTIEVFSEQNYELMPVFKCRVKDVITTLHTETGVPLEDLEKSAAYYVTVNSFFFMENFKNAHDAGATKLTLTLTLDVAKQELICTMKDNGKGFSSMFALPAKPEELPKDANEAQKKEYILATEKYERKLSIQRSKDPSGMADYRKIIDPQFNPEVGTLKVSTVTSGKEEEATGASKPGDKVYGGRGIGLSSTATLLHNVTGGRGKIQIGDSASLASNSELQAIAGPPIPDARTGAVTMFSTPLYSPDLRQVITDASELSTNASTYLEHVKRVEQAYAPVQAVEEGEEMIFTFALPPKEEEREEENEGLTLRLPPLNNEEEDKLSFHQSDSPASSESEASLVSSIGDGNFSPYSVLKELSSPRSPSTPRRFSELKIVTAEPNYSTEASHSPEVSPPAHITAAEMKAKFQKQKSSDMADEPTKAPSSCVMLAKLI